MLYATCFANYNNPGIGVAARNVLAKNGVETEVVHPRCCGMPQLEHGDIAAVAESADNWKDALLNFVSNIEPDAFEGCANVSSESTVLPR